MKFIREYPGAVPHELCESLINFLEHYETIGKTFKGKNGSTNDVEESIKASTDYDMQFDEDKDIIDEIKQYLNPVTMDYFNSTIVDPDGNYGMIKNIAQIENFFELLQGPKLMRYRQNAEGYHAYHMDWMPGAPITMRRMLAAMIYLNDVEEGGETEFFHQEYFVKPKQGTIIVFPTYFTHQHKGHVPISNDKYVLNMFLG